MCSYQRACQQRKHSLWAEAMMLTYISSACVQFIFVMREDERDRWQSVRDSATLLLLRKISQSSKTGAGCFLFLPHTSTAHTHTHTHTHTKQWAQTMLHTCACTQAPTYTQESCTVVGSAAAAQVGFCCSHVMISPSSVCVCVCVCSCIE